MGIFFKKKWQEKKRRLAAFLALCLACIGFCSLTPARALATSISELESQISATQSQISEINSQIAALEDEQDVIDEQISDISAEVLNFMTSISLMEDEIAEKEAQLAEKAADIEQTEYDIAQTQAAYEAAKENQAAQYDAMVLNLRKMYQAGGESSYLSLLFSGGSLSNFLNRLNYIEKLYAYDQEQLSNYEAAKEVVMAIWNTLEEEKLSLEADKLALEEEKLALEETEAELDALKAELDVQLAALKAQSANYDAEISKYTQEAAVAKTQLKQEQAELKALQEEEARKAAEAAAAAGGTTTSTTTSTAASGTYTSNYNSVIDAATGSELGKQIAKYACQFIGNPYVAGGTSLTNGADCSGFTYRVYADFGYTLPRTSTQQRSAGTEVSYADAQPGDLICYSGHVALYIGGGLIVHASTAKTGIKISNANYRTILSVRRIV